MARSATALALAGPAPHTHNPQPGQKVFLPPFDPVACGEGVPVQKPSGCQAYTVQPGDALFDIANKVREGADCLLSAQLNNAVC